ncbi:MAG: hypothetical protein ABI654_06645 [Betaproteobacteria bacterium]
MRPWSSEAVETVLAAQGIRLAPGRAAKLAAGLEAAIVADALRDALPFESDPSGYALAVERCKRK